MYRRYQACWNRFAQPDPYDGSYNLDDPQSLNRYTYTQNDPVNFVDPSGLNLEAPDGSSRPRDGGSLNGFWGNTLGALNHANDQLFDVEFNAPVTWYDPQLGYWVGAIATVDAINPPIHISITGGPGTLISVTPIEIGGGVTVTLRPLEPVPVPPCVTSPYINFSLSVGTALAGVSISLLASQRGIYLQPGGGLALSPRRLFRFPPRIQRIGPNFSIRASRSGITPGYGETSDFGPYARNYDAHAGT